MTTSNLTKAGILAIILVLFSVTSWEIYLRSKMAVSDFDDSPGLWANLRRQVYQPKEKATAFIGSSRIKFDLDQSAWQSLTGDQPLQLAIEGATPIPVLKDLAADKNFKGKLVIDVTEILFFSNAPPFVSEPNKNIKFYKDQTPSEHFSFMVNRVTESNLYFLDKGNYSLNALLDKMEIPSRKGVFVFPVFPPDFDRTSFTRQSSMTDRFLQDTLQQNQVRAIWKYLGDNMREPPPSGENLTAFFHMVKDCTDKIKARGGEVIFTRTPSSGPFLMGEKQGFPREKYWDQLLAVTGCQGIYFEDYPSTAHFQCPEFSHLSPPDAKKYTTELVKQLQEKGWKFSKS
ncbi:MAG: hypothetical protein JWN76_1917 [Chitinophagaceae bacterium]|nr:hypothetical protein [Chitinophagaceae bacterium]